MVIHQISHNLVLEEFFHQKIKEALKAQNVNVSEEVQFYLVKIMTHFSKSENLFQYDDDGKVEYRALALRLYDSVFAESKDEQFQHLKTLADTALYHAGVFYDGLYNQVVDVGYYINMGGAAYRSLANLSTGYRKSLAEIFYELSLHFAMLVEVLNICCEKEINRSDADILKLLDRYIKTGSQKAKVMLEEEGILPDSLVTNKTVQ